jgi:membrane protein implicated in regulation of membrane protease activity
VLFRSKAHGWIVGLILAATGITLFLLRPFTVSGAIWAAIVALVLILIVQLVRRPSEPAEQKPANTKSQPKAKAKPKKPASA